MDKTKTDIEKVLDFCERRIKVSQGKKSPQETDTNRIARLAEEVAYKNVIHFIKKNHLK